MPAIAINPIQDAIERLRSRVPVASKIRTKDWAQVPVGLRDRAQFSAGVDTVQTLQGFGEELDRWATLGREDPVRAFRDRSKFVAEARRKLGAAPGDTGDLRDITSRRRQELIYDFQTADAAEFARMKISSDPDVLDAFPAMEFLRIENRRVPREEWPERWVAACQAAGDERALAAYRSSGRMIALKGSRVWIELSRFRKPWPPFEFGSGMGTEDLGRDDAEELGLINRSEQPPSPDLEYNKELKASVENLDPDLQAKLKEWFGDQIKIEEGTAQWVAEEPAT